MLDISQASIVAQLVKNLPAMWETRFNSWVRKIPWRRVRLPTPVFSGSPGGSAGKESAHNAGDLGLIPGLGRLPGEGKSYPLQYSGLENSMDCIDHVVTKSWNCVTFILILTYHIFHCDHLNAFLSSPQKHTQVLKSYKGKEIALFIFVLLTVYTLNIILSKCWIN